MKKHRLRHILILFAGIAFIAGTPLPSPGMPLEHLLSKVQSTYDETKTFRASFTQTATMASINKTITEEGTLYLKKPSRMLWEYTKPANKKLILNPDTAWLYLPDEHAVYVQDAQPFLSSRITIGFLTGSGNLQKDFHVAYSTPNSRDDRGNYLMTLIPRHYESGITELLLTIRDSDYTIIGCTFMDMYKNTTHITFTNISINTAMPDTLFTFTAPEDAQVYSVP
jgi:outer membrane lipoprotein carrier protein